MFSGKLINSVVIALSLPLAFAFDPCPILGPNFPQPTGIGNSATIKNATQDLERLLNQAIATGNSSHGPLGEKSTSFSIALFTLPDRTKNSTSPYFWDFHYTAPSLRNSSEGARAVDANTIYRIGSMTQVFTVWTLPANTGERYLDRPVTDFVPELATAAASCSSSRDPIGCVDWCEVTLRELGSHLAGVGRDECFQDIDSRGALGLHLGLASSNATQSHDCSRRGSSSREQFFRGFLQRAPVYAPGTTPIFSNATFQILAYALEKISGKSFARLFQESILSPLHLSNSSISFEKPSDAFKGAIPGNFTTTGWNLNVGDESPSLGLYSNIRDFATAGQAMLSSALLKPAQTRRWLKPVSLTSNNANSNGMPWMIYSQPTRRDGPIIDIYTYVGGIGAYSSYLGLVPNYNVGFVLLAAGSDASFAGTVAPPDLNAHADFVGDVLVPALEKTAISQAIVAHAGTYVDGNTGAKLTINSSYSPTGLEVTSFRGVNGTDLKASLAELNGITAGPDALSFRLFPTNLETEDKRAFRAVYQDTSAFEDAGTATCISWMSVDQLVYRGEALDRFVFEYRDGKAVGLEAPGFGLRLIRQKNQGR